MKRSQGLWLVVVGLVVSSGVARSELWGNTQDITTATDVVRTWDDVVAGNFVYGPKQSYDAGIKETHIWMPYGNTEGLYYSGNNVGFTDPSGGSVGGVYNTNAARSSYLTLKFHFDQPIQSFRYSDGWSSWNLQPDEGDVIAGGLEYSVNGTDWVSLVEMTSPYSAILEPVVDNVGAMGLNTQDLFLRYYTRNKTTPASMSGGARYFQLRSVGAPDWGPSGFFGNQSDLYVTTPEPATVGLFTLAGLLLRRKNIG